MVQPAQKFWHALSALATVAVVVSLFFPWHGGFSSYLSRPIGATSFTGFFIVPSQDEWHAIPVTAGVLLGIAIASLATMLVDVIWPSRVSAALVIVGTLAPVVITVWRAAEPAVRLGSGDGQTAALIASCVGLAAAAAPKVLLARDQHAGDK